MTGKQKIAGFCLSVFLSWTTAHAQAANQNGMVRQEMGVAWHEAWPKLKTAIQKNQMGIVSRASASAGATGRGVIIPGNMVIDVLRNDFAVRMLAASVDAGIEAPLRFYLTETLSGNVQLSYRKPVVTFAPYGAGDLAVLARELDEIFARIASDAVK